MKTISMMQPWALFWLLGIKKFETRSWRIKNGLPVELYLHASRYPTDPNARAVARRLVDEVCRSDRTWPFCTLEDFPIGRILGSIQVTDCYPTEALEFLMPECLLPREKALGDYTPGRWFWEAHYRTIFKDPPKAKGALYLWDYDGEKPEAADLYGQRNLYLELGRLWAHLREDRRTA
ncbi:MAG: hypothetical protein M5U26_08305 [Planctomycetota bacterium]|nr:hypothetical protein [Planctomycetota bacterium]